MKYSAAVLRSAFIAFIAFIAFATQAHAQFSSEYDDKPGPQEDFTSFMIRITRGGTFSGIRLKAPPAFEKAFLKRIARGGWNKAQADAASRLKQQGVDLWFNWYKEKSPWKVIVNSPADRAELSRAIVHQAELLKQKVDPANIIESEWDTLPRVDREIVIRAFILDAKLFGGRRLIDFLADEYDASGDDAINLMSYHLLAGPEFKQALVDLGYTGPIYFRGLTAPDPKDPSHDEILLNHDLILSQTTFQYPLYRALEAVMISIHEMSHVFQDHRARERKIDLSVHSPESVLILEGMAETLAERALARAGNAMTPPNPLALFAAEEGVEVVYRPGNGRSGSLFPYTIGLPFATALLDSATEKPEKAKLRDEMLDVIRGELSLEELLRKLFTP